MALASATSGSAQRIRQHLGRSAARPFALQAFSRRTSCRYNRMTTILASAAGFRAAGHAPMPAKPADLPLDNMPLLINRRISANPLDTVAAMAAHAFSHLDLLMATTIDKLAWAGLVAAALVGASAATGLCLHQQLGGSQPAWLLNALEDRLGPSMLLALTKQVPLLVAAPLALWHLRSWWAISTEAFRHVFPSTPGDTTSSPTAVSPASTLATLARFAAMLSAVAAAAASGLASPLSVLGPLLLSFAPFAVAAATASASKPAGPVQASGAPQPATAAARVTKTAAQPAAQPAGFAQAAPLMLPLLAADAAAVASAALWSTGSPLSLIAAAVAGAVLAASLAAATMQPQYTRRLAPVVAKVGDSALVHITIKTDFGSQIDTSAGKRPLAVTVGSAVDEFAVQRLGSELAASVLAVTAADAKADQRAGGSAPSTSGRGGGPAAKAREVEQEGPSSSDGGSQSLIDPLSPEMAQGTMRFCTPLFAGLLDVLVPGMLVGERVRVQVHNPPPEEGGFVNPDLVWWQPLDDVETKFKAGMPSAGQVFWFPLGPGPQDNLVPVRVNAVTDEFVEMVGNDHIEGGEMVVEVQLVGLNKQGSA